MIIRRPENRRTFFTMNDLEKIGGFNDFTLKSNQPFKTRIA